MHPAVLMTGGTALAAAGVVVFLIAQSASFVIAALAIAAIGVLLVIGGFVLAVMEDVLKDPPKRSK